MKISKVKSRNLYSANVRKPDGGYKKVYGKTKKEVREKAESLAFDIKSGKFVEDNRITLYEWLDEWSGNYLIDVSENTAETYTRGIRQRIKPYLKDKRLQKLTHNDVQQYITRLSKKYAPKTVRNTHLILHRALRDAVKNGYIAVNPSDDVLLPREVKFEIIPLDKNEVKEFLEIAYATEPLYADLFEFMILTGLRLGEVIGLTVDSYDPETNTIRIDKQYLYNFKKFAPPKHGVERMIVLSNRAAHIVENRIQNNVPELNTDNVIFATENFTIISPNGLRRVFNRIKKKLDKPNLRIHDLRHTFATLTLDSGTDIKTLQKLLGHSDATFTMNKYAHSTMNMQKDAAQKLDEYFAEIDTKLTQNQF